MPGESRRTAIHHKSITHRINNIHLLSSLRIRSDTDCCQTLFPWPGLTVCYLHKLFLYYVYGRKKRLLPAVLLICDKTYYPFLLSCNHILFSGLPHPYYNWNFIVLGLPAADIITLLSISFISFWFVFTSPPAQHPRNKLYGIPSCPGNPGTFTPVIRPLYQVCHKFRTVQPYRAAGLIAMKIFKQLQHDITPDQPISFQIAVIQRFRLIPVYAECPADCYPVWIVRVSVTYEGERLRQMTNRIESAGLLNPMIVRPAADNKYKMICGHNRAKAMTSPGRDVFRADIRRCLSDDEAARLYYDSSLNQ